MNYDEIITVVNEIYNVVTGIVLTGSQLKTEYYNELSDIDVMIIDARFSVVSPFTTNIGGRNYDFTQVPLFDIENVLLNESNDAKSLFLSMLVNGVIIKDTPANIINQIKIKAKWYYGLRSFVVNDQFQFFLAELKRLKKDFYKQTVYEQKFIHVNEFFYLITQAELAKATNWLPSGKHKSAYLLQKNGEFITNVIDLVNKSLEIKDTAPAAEIADFLDLYFQKNDYPGHTYSNDRCIIDIKYTGASLENFLEKLLPAIRSNNVLANRFLYFFKSPALLHLIYRNKISLVFGVEENSFDGTFNELKTTVANLFGNGAAFSIVPSVLFTPQNPNQYFLRDFQTAAKEISLMAENQLYKAAYDYEKMLSIGVILFAFIIRYLNIQNQDVININTMMAQRYILTKGEQTNILKPSAFDTGKAKKLESFNAYYQGKKDYFDSLFKKGMHYADSESPDTLKEYYLSIAALKDFLYKQIGTPQPHVANNILLATLLNELYGIKEVEKGVLYFLVLQQTMEMLNFRSVDASYCLFILTKSIN